MSVGTTSPFWTLDPYSDPGQLFGGIRRHVAVLNAIQADAFREASQNQQATQTAQSQYGAQTTNDQAQTVSLSQDATATNSKQVTIDGGQTPILAAFPLFSYLAGSDAADYRSRAAAKAVQNQGADQSAVGKEKSSTGAGSKAYNNLSQDAQATQTFDVDIDSTVVNTTTAVQEDTLFNKSRFRRIEAKDLDNAAQAIFTSGQRQGYTADPVSQTAVSGARNVLAQTATLDQTGDVLTSGTHDLRRSEDFLVPRSTDIRAQVENNSSVNSSAAVQEQNLQQNGGTGKARNDSTATAVNADAVTVTNTVSILI